jgi:hypothetical protein
VGTRYDRKEFRNPYSALLVSADVQKIEVRRLLANLESEHQLVGA